MSDVENGNWFCPNCGYISSGRVTFNVICSKCRTPVDWHWHTAEQKELAAELKVKVRELEAENMRLRYAWFRSADYATRSLSDLPHPPEE